MFMSKIISGGQTGVDRAALDVAIALGIPHGGWCPRGRVAEDGQIPARYQLTETESGDYAIRTQLNVRDSDATLILTRGPLSGGTAHTSRQAQIHGRPCRVVDLAASCEPQTIRRWLQSLATDAPIVLNVAGPRESGAVGIACQAA